MGYDASDRETENLIKDFLHAMELEGDWWQDENPTVPELED